MNKKSKHICFKCELARVIYSEVSDKEIAICQATYEQASCYRDKVFSAGALIECPAFKERKNQSLKGG